MLILVNSKLIIQNKLTTFPNKFIPTKNIEKIRSNDITTCHEIAQYITLLYLIIN